MLAFAAAVPTASLLAGTSWSVALDIGAERGSWMPPTWGRSGARATPTVRVSLEEGERVLLRETGYFDRTKWEPEGAYELDGGTLRFWLEHKGIEKDDTILEPGKLYFAAPHFAGTQLLGKKGMLTIRHRQRSSAFSRSFRRSTRARSSSARAASRRGSRLVPTMLRPDE